MLGQNKAWKAHHQRTCAFLSRGFHLSTAFMNQGAEQQANTDLLLNMWGHISLPSKDDTWIHDQSDVDLEQLASDPVHCFKDLTLNPHPRGLPELPSSILASHTNFLVAAWSRFDCNNFVIHNVSSLEPESGAYALGVFPLASRCFNHSCSPNAWSAFRLRDGQIWLEVRALETITDGTEVRGTSPYIS